MQIANRFGQDFNLNQALNELKEVISISNVNLTLIETNGEIILSPRGERLLDKELVEEVFKFLHEASQKHLVDAVKFYNKQNEKDSIKSAESVRRCLEEFLRYKLGNQNGLDKNIQSLTKSLKCSDKSIEIRNIIMQTFSYLDKYFNEHNKFSKSELLFTLGRKKILVRGSNFTGGALSNPTIIYIIR